MDMATYEYGENARKSEAEDEKLAKIVRYQVEGEDDVHSNPPGEKKKERNLPRRTGERKKAVAFPCNSRFLERRWILLTYAFVTTSLVAGAVYGWPALRLQLKQEGSTLTEAQLGAIYTAGSWSAQGGRFFTGLARDQFGSRLVAVVVLLCTLCGAVGIAFSSPNNGISLGISLFVMSLGSGLQLVMQPVGSLFPGCSNAVVSSLSGAFQISGLVFLVLCNIISSSAKITRSWAFVGYAMIVAFLTTIAWFLLPASASFDKPSTENKKNEDTNGSSQDIEMSSSNDEENDKDDCESDEKDRSDSDDLTKLQQIVSIEYIGLLLWFSIALVPLQYYIGSIGFQLESKGDTDGFYTNLFAIAYSAAAGVAPFGGYLSDVVGLGLTQGLCTALAASSFFILASEGISLAGQTSGLILYSIGRMFIFSMFFSNVGRRFGYTNFGTLSGIGLLVSALCSILQYPLIAAASRGSADIVNYTSGIILLCLLPYCAWLAYIERRMSRAKSLLR